jgi:hypothetical protein
LKNCQRFGHGQLFRVVVGNVVFGRIFLGQIVVGPKIKWVEKRKLAEKYFNEISIIGDRF